MLGLLRNKQGGGQLGFVRKVDAGRIAAMIGWRPAWQSVTNSPTHRGN